MMELLGPLNRYIHLFVFAFGALIGGYGVYKIICVPMSREKTELLGKMAAERVLTDTALEANKTGQATIDILQLRLNKMVEERRVEKELAAAEIEKRRAAEVAARHQTDKLRAEVSRAWGVSKDCESFRDVHLAAVCPDVAGRLRERSSY